MAEIKELQEIFNKLQLEEQSYSSRKSPNKDKQVISSDLLPSFNQSIEKNDNINKSNSIEETDDKHLNQDASSQNASKVLSNPRAQALHEYIQQRVSNSSSQKSDIGQIQPDQDQKNNAQNLENKPTSQNANISDKQKADPPLNQVVSDTHKKDQSQVTNQNTTDNILDSKYQAYQNLIEQYQLSDDEVFKDFIQQNGPLPQQQQQQKSPISNIINNLNSNLKSNSGNFPDLFNGLEEKNDPRKEGSLVQEQQQLPLDKLDQAMNKIITKITDLSQMQGQAPALISKSFEPSPISYKQQQVKNKKLKEQKVQSFKYKSTQKLLESVQQHQDNSVKIDTKEQQEFLNSLKLQQAKPQKMSPEKFKEIIDRQFENYKLHQEKIQNLIQDKEEQELKNLKNFKASSQSVKMLSGKYVPIQKRQQEIIEKKKQKIEQRQKDQKEKEEQEVQQCTFQPQINKKSQTEFKNRNFLNAQYDWLQQHNQNVNNKRAQLEEDCAKEIKLIPTINSNFKFQNNPLQQTYIQENVAERLYEKHEQIQQKLEVMRQQTIPNFQPIITPKSRDLAYKKRLKDSIYGPNQDQPQ